MVPTSAARDPRPKRLAELLSVEIAMAAMREEAARNEKVAVSTWEDEIAKTSRSTSSALRHGRWPSGEPQPATLKKLIRDIYPADTDEGAENRELLRARVWDVMGWGADRGQGASKSTPAARIDDPDLRRRPKVRQLLATLADPLVPERVKDRLERRVGLALLEEELLRDPSGQSEVDEAL